eukprot:1161829-Pelagomonas_calceolata.AAC.7
MRRVLLPATDDVVDDDNDDVVDDDDDDDDDDDVLMMMMMMMHVMPPTNDACHVFKVERSGRLRRASPQMGQSKSIVEGSVERHHRWVSQRVASREGQSSDITKVQPSSPQKNAISASETRAACTCLTLGALKLPIFVADQAYKALPAWCAAAP